MSKKITSILLITVFALSAVSLSGFFALPNMNGDENINGIQVRHCDLDFPGGLRETDSLNRYIFYYHTNTDGSQNLLANKVNGTQVIGFRRSLVGGKGGQTLKQQIARTVNEYKFAGSGQKKLIVVYKNDKNYAYVYERSLN